jgi:transcriptional regulator with XRE-family HTH domain
MLAGLSGRELARAAGLSQSAVSRAERGESVLSLPEVTAWAGATGASEDRRAVLLALAEAAVNEVATFRVRLGSGLAAVQDSVRDLEASARVVRNFQPGIIPGLLQTAGYARRIMALAAIGHDASIGAAAAARLARQETLHNPARSFEFLITEAALRYRPGSPDVPTAPAGDPPAARTHETLTAQLDHLAAVATLETISFGVIPADAEMHAITRCGFILYEQDRRPAAARRGRDPARRAVCQRPSRRRRVPGPARPPAPVSCLRRRRPRHRPVHRPPLAPAGRDHSPA